MKTSEQIAKENAEVIETSLSMMQELLATTKRMLIVLEDIAEMCEEALDVEPEDPDAPDPAD